MHTEERVIELLRELSPEQQVEVLDFAAFLKERQKRVRSPRPYGLCDGAFQVPDDFDAPLPETEIALFES
ncbi:DUF2281 domain-containing protein [Allochromatium palmeri]|uniref:DUF2281 domain-containing protein n=1 Tax=Allochromatium palmeri TaxID=231048 RepID=A0A6N8EEB6_9GAMM|nr:DUF2281 domain-containing protein [Allochromatium palmeri]MTW22602.1 DUF2281 domain-containing protein [Allochromatium palmeri]